MHTLQFDSFDPSLVRSTPQVRTDLFRRPLNKVLVTDFFGSVRSIELQNASLGEGETDVPTASGCGSDNEWAGKDTPVYMMNPRDVLVSVKCCLYVCIEWVNVAYILISRCQGYSRVIKVIRFIFLLLHGRYGVVVIKNTYSMRNPRVLCNIHGNSPRGFALVLVPIYFIKHSVSCYIYYIHSFVLRSCIREIVLYCLPTLQ